MLVLFGRWRRRSFSCLQRAGVSVRLSRQIRLSPLYEVSSQALMSNGPAMHSTRATYRHSSQNPGP
jgi:hypothetical protein